MSQVIEDYEQYISSAMEEVYGKPSSKLDPEVDGDVKHCEGQHDDDPPYNMIYATLRLTGRVVTSKSWSGDKYNSVGLWGHRFEDFQQFMKEQGYELHMIKQFDNRTKDKPEIDFSFTMEGLR